MARILDHEHDAIVLGPGAPSGPRDRGARANAPGRPRRAPRSGADRPRRGGAAIPGDARPVVDRRRAAVRPDAPPGRVRAPARGRGHGAGRRRWRPVLRRRGPPERGQRGRNDVAPGRRVEGREDGDRRAGRNGQRRTVREPGARDRRHGRRAGGDHRRAARAGPGAGCGRPPRRVPARDRRRPGPGSASATRACSRRTSRTSCPWSGSASRPSRNGAAPGSGSASRSAWRTPTGRAPERVDGRELDRGPACSRRPAAAPADGVGRDRPGRACRQPRGAAATGGCGHGRAPGGEGRRVRPRHGPGRARAGGRRRRRLVRGRPR